MPWLSPHDTLGIRGDQGWRRSWPPKIEAPVEEIPTEIPPEIDSPMKKHKAVLGLKIENGYPLVNCYITMERSTFFKGKNPRNKLPFSIATLNYLRVFTFFFPSLSLSINICVYTQMWLASHKLFFATNTHDTDTVSFGKCWPWILTCRRGIVAFQAKSVNPDRSKIAEVVNITLTTGTSGREIYIYI